MRTAFIDELLNSARTNPNIFLVVGDVGFNVVEPFAEAFPDRYRNVGIAEQNMTGVAAGLASEGFHVFTYSIGNFPTLRCLEQIRNDVCYHNLPVTVVAVGAGMAYGNMGYSHHCVQDIACLRGLPNMNLLSPGDPGETRACVKWLNKNPGPSYLRLGKAGEPTVHSLEVRIGHNLKVVERPAARHAIVATGSVLNEAVGAAELLQARGIDCDVFSCIRLAPITSDQFDDLHDYDAVCTVEDHVGPGGLGELVRGQLPGSVKCIATSIGPELSTCVGSQAALRQLAGLDAESIANLVSKQLLLVS